MLFAEERERRVVKEACDVCSTWIARVVHVSPVLKGHEFWRREGGRLVATPMFGLRSLYFVVSDALDRLRYLRPGLATVLLFTGTKMIISEWVHISPGMSVSVIVWTRRDDCRVTVAAKDSGVGAKKGTP